MKLIGGPCDGLSLKDSLHEGAQTITVPFCRTLLEGLHGIFGSHVYSRLPDGSYHFSHTIPPKPHPGLGP